MRLRQKDDADRDVVLAWQVVRIYVQTMNEKRVPLLKTLLGESGEKSVQTPNEQRAMLTHLSKVYGIPLRVKES